MAGILENLIANNPQLQAGINQANTMPNYAQGGRATQGTSEDALNQMNLAMRQQPWYQDYFRSRGLNPDHVKLDGRQRQELTQLAAQNGFTLGDRMKVDAAGNFNQMGGFAGMPTAAKWAIGAAPVAGAMLIPGVREAVLTNLGSLFGAGGGGVGSAGTGAGLTAAGGAPTAASTGMSLAMGSGAFPTVAELGATLPTLGSTAIGGTASVAPSLSGLGTIGGTVGGGGGGSFLSNGAKKVGQSVIDRFTGGNGQNAADIGSMFERFANDEARKRVGDFEMQDRWNQDMLQAQQDRRAQESDAMRKIQQAGYIKSGGQPFDASQVKLSGGRELPSFAFPRAPITDEAKQAAGMLEKTMLDRLGPNGSFTPRPVEDFQRRGVGEQIGRWGSIGSSVLPFAKGVWDLFS